MKNSGVLSNCQHRTGGLADNAVGGGAHHEFFQKGVAVDAQYNQVHFFISGILNQFPVGVPRPAVWFQGCTSGGFLREPCGGAAGLVCF